MRKRVQILGWFLYTTLCGTDGNAQSVYGPGGLLLHPTAYAPDKGQLIASVLGRQQDMSNAPSAGYHNHHTVALGLDYGLTERAEIGLSYMRIRGDIHSSPTFGPFAKYRLVRESERRPQVAIGGVWLPNNHWRTQFGFVVASKRLTGGSDRPVHGHLGMMYASFLNHFRADDWAGYAGLDIGLTRSLKLVAECRTRTSADYGLPSVVGLVWGAGQGMTLAVGLTNDGAGRKHQLSIGAGYTASTLD